MTADHLVDMLKKRLPDSKIMKDVKMDRTKCTAIVNRVIGATETEETVSNLQNDNPFAILVDESTDIGMKKKLLHPHQLLELDAKDCSAESLYEAFKACLDEHGIPVKNCIGMASDNSNTMVGRNTSFWTRLRTDAPCAVLINCICHSAHLVATHGCIKSSSNCKKLMQDVSYVCAPNQKSSENFTRRNMES
ncbi:hypothetical protein FOCC_FOCC015983 [Frankliniella occidentalis]|nr:hypothetical protein FOCC_FOCC015983 [Frankliniella occidentalis]